MKISFIFLIELTEKITMLFDVIMKKKPENVIMKKYANSI